MPAIAGLVLIGIPHEAFPHLIDTINPSATNRHNHPKFLGYSSDGKRFGFYLPHANVEARKKALVHARRFNFTLLAVPQQVASVVNTNSNLVYVEENYKSWEEVHVIHDPPSPVAATPNAEPGNPEATSAPPPTFNDVVLKGPPRSDGKRLRHLVEVSNVRRAARLTVASTVREDDGSGVEKHEDAAPTTDAPFLRSLIAQDMLENMDACLLPVMQEDIITSLPRLAAKEMRTDRVKAAVSSIVALACRYVQGKIGFYLPVTQMHKPRSFSPAERKWCETHKAELQAAAHKTSRLQVLADKFSQHFGYARFHAVTFYDLVYKHKDLTGVGRTPTIDGGIASMYFPVMFVLLDSLRRLDNTIDPSLHFQLVTIRSSEWYAIFAFHFSEMANSIVRPHTVMKKLQKDVNDAVGLPADKKTAFRGYMTRNLTVYHLRERIASGLLLPGNLRKEDAIMWDCWPIPPFERSHLDLNDPGWVVTTPSSLMELVPLLPELLAVDEGSRALQAIQPQSYWTADSSFIIEGGINDSSICPEELADITEAMNEVRTGATLGDMSMFIIAIALRMRYLEDNTRAQVAISLVNKCHLFAALSTINMWIHVLGFENPKIVLTEGMDERDNPMHQLSLRCQTTATEKPSVWAIQRALVHPSLQHHPLAVVPISYDSTGFAYKITYRSTLKAVEMLDEVIHWSMNHSQTQSDKSSQPLTFFHQPVYTDYCLKCGRIGHDENACKDVAVQVIDGCATCKLVGDPSPCSMKPCKLVHWLLKLDEHVCRTLTAAIGCVGIANPTDRELVTTIFQDV